MQQAIDLILEKSTKNKHVYVDLKTDNPSLELALYFPKNLFTDPPPKKIRMTLTEG